MPATIRLLRPGDEALFLRLARQFYQSPLSAEQAQALLKRDGHFLLCLLEEGQPAGFCYFHLLPQWYSGKKEVFLYDIEVEERHRRKGYGRQLFREAARFARDRGASTVWLMVERSNTSALAFYQALGGSVQEEEGVLVEFKV